MMGNKMRYVVILAMVLVMCGSVWAAWDPKQDQKEMAAAQETVSAFNKADSSMAAYFDSAYGYVVFPNVGKGGLIIGGARGKGYVFEKGAMIGYASVTEVTVGAQIGGQAFSEVIFFKDKGTLDTFKQGNFEFSAQVSAVAATEGASKNTSYSKGVAVFTLPKGGAMAEATVGGQKFSYKPK